ncbi:MAG: carbon-nitrogen hydrolase family protein [Verrucomicrobiales bacterium]|nr:carbon-nitrogen hydrolase family protein [Verrucomicrobiales bacterium]
MSSPSPTPPLDDGLSNAAGPPKSQRALQAGGLAAAAVLSALCYHAAMRWEPFAVWLVAASLAFLVALTSAGTARRAFYTGIAAALLTYVPHLWFLRGIFSVTAIPLWCCLALWPGFFCGTLHVVRRKAGPWAALAAAPLLWMGFEYIRSEVWLLRFTWMTPGFGLPAARMGWAFGELGVYGAGALLALAGAGGVLLKKHIGAAACLLLLPALLLLGKIPQSSPSSLRVTGVQFEEALPIQLLEGLENARLAHPDTQLFLLPEYSFSDTPPEEVLAWCRLYKTHLIAGGREYLPGEKNSQHLPAYYNMAFVIGPEGTVIHKQAKSRPIQFFDDGRPAPSQAVWNSPWGRIGICICYDQNYREVTDPLAAQGMQALVIPTLDLETWGEHQHWLSARLAATRAVEHGVPVLRLASSGYSQFIDAQGRILASGSMPGQGEIVSAVIPMASAPRMPLDHWIAPAAPYFSGLMILWALTVSFIDERRRLKAAVPPPNVVGNAP